MDASADERFVYFNVGGQRFLLSSDSLRQHAQTATPTATAPRSERTFLTALCDPFWSTSVSSTEPSSGPPTEPRSIPTVLLDRDPHVFAGVVYFLRTGRFAPSALASVPLDLVLDELAYFGYAVPRCSQTLRWWQNRALSTERAEQLAALPSELALSLRRLVATAVSRCVACAACGGSEVFGTGAVLLAGQAAVESALAKVGLPGVKPKVAGLLSSVSAHRGKCRLAVNSGSGGDVYTGGIASGEGDERGGINEGAALQPLTYDSSLLAFLSSDNGAVNEELLQHIAWEDHCRSAVEIQTVVVAVTVLHIPVYELSFASHSPSAVAHESLGCAPTGLPRTPSGASWSPVGGLQGRSDSGRHLQTASEGDRAIASLDRVPVGLRLLLQSPSSPE